MAWRRLRGNDGERNLILAASFRDSIAFDANGLVPAIAQQHDTGEVLMMAWMNRAAIEETLQTGRVCYWSRSRSSLWRKARLRPAAAAGRAACRLRQ